MNASDPDTHSLIRAIAEDTRRILEQLDAESHEAAIAVRETFNGQPCVFPQNWCQYASCVLGLRVARVLRRGDIDFCEWNGDGAFESHFWLRFDGYDIDITADQFGAALPPVLVETNFKAHEERFPAPSVRPLLARRTCRESFERAVLELDLAVHNHARAVDRDIAIDRHLRSCEGASHE